MALLKGNWKVRLSLFFGLGFFLFFFFLISQFGSPIFSFLQRPFAAVGLWTGTQWQFLFGEARHPKAYAILQERISFLARDAVSYEQLRTENKNLKEQLAFVERSSFGHVTARIVMWSVNPIHHRFIIDRGTKDGVVVGASAIIGDGIFVGKILEVHTHTSLVQTSLDPDSKIAVSLLNTSRTIGLAQGTGGALLSFEFIPQDEDVQINQLLVTSGLEEGIPPNLLVGVVNRVTKDPTAPFQQATVEPLVDIRRYGIISILIPSVAL